MHSRTQLAIYGLRNYFMPGLNDATVALIAGGVRIASLYSILRLLLLGKGDSALVYGRSLCREHGGIFWRCRRCVTTGKPSVQGFSGASVASARLSKCGWNIGQWVTAATACSREAMDFVYGAIAALPGRPSVCTVSRTAPRTIVKKRSLILRATTRHEGSPLAFMRQL